ncbi:MAG: ABC transporter substrate-binding protein [Desulfobacteraceae bacterium]|nr:ABC transporter substrate-binding protein [Desulfobacteraceae bacterium]
MFKCNNITYQYSNTDTCIFKNLTFGIDSYGFHALFGPSGVGKTTLARIISNNINEYSGEIKSREINNILYSYNMERLPGDIYSDVHGIFTKAGLQVSVKAGGPERDAIKELEIGHAQFGVASADQVIRARSKGSPVVVIAQLFQINPLQWIYRPEPSPLNSPGKLKGNIIGITYGGNDETIMRALLSKYNITEKDVTFFSVRYDYTPFYSRQVRFWPVYRNTQALVIGGKLRSAGEEFLFW